MVRDTLTLVRGLHALPRLASKAISHSRVDAALAAVFQQVLKEAVAPDINTHFKVVSMHIHTDGSFTWPAIGKLVG